MKKATEIRYPNSANLFQFCRKVLDHKFGGIRVIDQDVGQILGFDPADCSHWKKGKKNIRSIQAMKSIAEHLGVDERLVVDVAAGDMDDNEAFFEFSGYGTFEIDVKVLETAKKDFYRRFAGSWSKEKEQEFKDNFYINENIINIKVKEIHEKINFVEAPLYIPEIINAYPTIKLEQSQEISKEEEIQVVAQGEQTSILTKNGAEMRPYIRFKMAKGLALHFLKGSGFEVKKEILGEYADHVADIHYNLFAAKLLAPSHLIKHEMAQINVAKDIVAQLSEIFWVSKNFMNKRLKDILQKQPEI